jgi:hypothetical protein
MEYVEFPEVFRPPIHFGHEPDVRPLVVQRLRQANVKIRGQDGSGKAAQNQLRQIPITCADVFRRTDQIQQHLLPVGLWLKQMLHRQRKILRQPAFVVDEPGLLIQPPAPFGCLDLLRQDLSNQNALRKDTLRNALDGLVCQRNA